MKYTPEQTQFAISMYTSAQDPKQAVQEIAQELDRTPQSVIAKLTREGVYKRSSVASERPVLTRKSEYVTGIEIMLSLNPGALASLEKANAKDLETIMKSLVGMSDRINANTTK